MQDYNPYLNWLRDQANAMLAMTVKWSNINTGTFNLSGLKNCEQVILKDLAALNAEVKVQACETYQTLDQNTGELVANPLGNIIVATKRPEAKLQVMLGGHYDTVYPYDHSFQKCQPEKNNIINGPGVADMKGGLVVMLHALLCLERSPWAQNIGWTVFINPDEEIGSPGSRALIEELGRKQDCALIYEPSLDPEGTLASTRKGSGKFTFGIQGKASHAGKAFHEGVNAIVPLCSLIQKLDQLNGKLPGFSLNVGKVSGGKAVNMVPDYAQCFVDVRIEQKQNADWVTEQIQQIIQQVQQEYNIEVQKIGGFMRLPKTLEPKLENLFQAFTKVGNELDIPLAWQPNGGVCDGNNLAAIGVANLDSLGVRGDYIHSAREYMIIDSLAERACLSSLFLLQLASGEIKL